MQKKLSLKKHTGTSLPALPTIPHICHFFTYAKFLENKIYTEKRVNYNGFCDKIA